MRPYVRHIIAAAAVALLACLTPAGAEAQRSISRQSMPSRGSSSGSSGSSGSSESSSSKKEAMPDPSLNYCWQLIQPLGLRERVPMDTTLYNWFLPMVPSDYSAAFATTGSEASVGKNMVYMEALPMSDFFFRDAKEFWIPNASTMRFYNTRVPMTLLDYNFGGSRETNQDLLRGRFSGNVTPKLAIGALVDYPYTKGSYNYQAAKGFVWGLSASYIGDRYEVQAFGNNYNMTNKENGGITDDLYIIDPAALQGGVSTINPKSIPTFLTAAHSNVRGKELYMNHRYKVGYWHEERDEETDSLLKRVYIPVTSFVWTFDYKTSRHIFLNRSSAEEKSYWQNHYISDTGTDESTHYNSLSNTLGVSLLEGFNKYAKAGLSAFATYEIRHYYQAEDPALLEDYQPQEGLTPYPYDTRIAPKHTENLMWVGAQLTKQRGSLLNYEVTGQLGIVGAAAGEVKVDGNVSTHLRLLGDTVSVTGYGRFTNTTAPYLMQEFFSNHFIWKNDFGKTRRVRLGGIIDIAHTGTTLDIGVENVQNLIYFGPDCLPVQNGGSVQVVSARLQQDFAFRALNWRNTVVYQKSSNESVIPLPQLAVYSNLFLLFKVAKVMDVQMGVDCNYYTKYYGPGYQPSTMSFYNQRDTKVGGFPFMNAYVNMKLSKARFYVMFSHFNQGLFGENNYFSLPHYPLNPRRFQLGVSVDFVN